MRYLGRCSVVLFSFVLIASQSCKSSSSSKKIIQDNVQDNNSEDTTPDQNSSDTSSDYTNPVVGVDLDDANALYQGQLKIENEEHQAIANANVRVGNTNFTSDENGYVTIDNLSVTQIQTARITADQFMETSVNLRYADVGQSTRIVTLTAPQFEATIDAEHGAVLSFDNVGVTFTKNAFVTENGDAYQGEVQVNAKSFDPSVEMIDSVEPDGSIHLRPDFDLSRVPDGILMAEQSNGNMGQIMPEGMIDIDLKDEQGNNLELHGDSPAIVRITLTPYTTRQIGDILPLLSFDKNAGHWVSEGTCTVEALPEEQQIDGKTLQCVGLATHFSLKGVGAISGGSNVSCINYKLVVQSTSPIVKRTEWVEEATALNSNNETSTFIRSQNVLQTSDGTCNPGSSRYFRLMAMVDTQDGHSYVYKGSWDTAPALARTAAQQSGHKAGDVTAICWRCADVTKTFDLSTATPFTDNDHDSYAFDATNPALVDCNDNDASIHPGASEVDCVNVDMNCDGQTPRAHLTQDMAASAAEWNNVFCKRSCAVTSQETPQNLFDENCDGVVSDKDQDGHIAETDPSFAALKQQNPNLKGDCDDANASIHPGGTEIAGNLIDENCDGWIIDMDNDGYLTPSQQSVYYQSVQNLTNVSNENDRYSDCNDSNPNINVAQGDLMAEHVFAQFYREIEGRGIVRDASMCRYIDEEGHLNDKGQKLLIDANCDGQYQDLDGDGFIVPVQQENELPNPDLEIDCNDLDPRVSTQEDCLGAPDVGVDGGTCRPQIGPGPSNTDTDGDGLSDIVELRLGTNPNAEDTDNDGINDFIEVGNPSDPTDSDMDSMIDAVESNILDDDGDSLSNQNDSNPYDGPLSDFDHDGLTRAQEEILGTDPNMADTDFDGIDDAEEVGPDVDNPIDDDLNGVIAALQPNIACQISNDCSTSATCEDTSEGHICTCNEGYTGDGFTCNADMPSYLYVFVTDGMQGDFGGVQGADSLCNQAAIENNYDGTYKAMVVDDQNRIACTSANCFEDGISEHVDWVFIGNTEYRRKSDDVVIGTTNLDGLFTSLQHGFSSDYNGIFWTGLNSNFTSSNSNCSAFTVTSGSSSAGLADIQYYGFSYAFGGYSRNCNQWAQLICVQQLEMMFP